MVGLSDSIVPPRFTFAQGGAQSPQVGKLLYTVENLVNRVIIGRRRRKEDSRGM